MTAPRVAKRLRLLSFTHLVARLLLASVASLPIHARPGWSHCGELPHGVTPFCATPTIASIADGPWSAASTWDQNRVPGVGDRVRISPLTSVSYDRVSGEGLDCLRVEDGATLRFREDIATRLVVADFLVMSQGTLRIGSAALPIAAGVTAEVVFLDRVLDTVKDAQQFGVGLNVLGTLSVHGAPLEPTFARLSSLAPEPRAGDLVLSLAEPVTGWRSGDRLVLPDSRQLRRSELGEPRHWEELEIASLSPDGRQITLTHPLAHHHPGARDGRGDLVFLPHVMNLSRNVRFYSQNPAGVRGHTLFTDRARVDLRYASFTGLGRTTVAVPDNTVMDEHCHPVAIGSNQNGRYPVHAHHLAGPPPGSTPANGYQFTFIGNAIEGLPAGGAPKWGLVIHGSHYGLIRDNVVYRVVGSGIVFEDGNESWNLLEHNMAVRFEGDGSDHEFMVAGSGLFGVEGSCFWLRSYFNHVRDNVCANAIRGGIEGQFAGGLIPLFQGANPMMNPSEGVEMRGGSFTVGASREHWDDALPLLELRRNEVYGSRIGIDLWRLAPRLDNRMEEPRAWHVHEVAIKTQYQPALSIFAPELINDASVLFDPQDFAARNGRWPVGIAATSGYNHDLSVVGGRVHNFYAGLQPAGRESRFEAMELRNYINLEAGMSSAGTGWLKRAVDVVLEDVDLLTPAPAAPFPGKPFLHVDMNIDDAPALLGGSSNHFRWHERYAVQALGSRLRDGDAPAVAGDYRFYFREQAAGFLIPTTDPGEDDLGTFPLEPGPLDNQSAWLRYGLAIAGAVASCETSSPFTSGWLCPASTIGSLPPWPQQMERSASAGTPFRLRYKVGYDGATPADQPRPARLVTSGGDRNAVEELEPTALASGYNYLTRQINTPSGETVSRTFVVLCKDCTGAPGNQAPSVGAGPDARILPGVTLALAGQVSDDGLPDPPAALTHTWSATGPANVVFGDASALATAADFPLPGEYWLTLSVSDGELGASDALKVVVSDAPGNNLAPRVEIPNSRSVDLAGGLWLSAIVSDDGLPNPPASLTGAWSASGPGLAVFERPGGFETTVRFDLPGRYLLTLTVSDGELESSAQMSVLVSDGPPEECSPTGSDQPFLLAASGGQLTMTWGPLASAAHYRIVRGAIGSWSSHRSDDTAGAGACDAGSEPLHDDPDDLGDGGSYYYLVAGVNASGEGELGGSFGPRTPSASCP